MPCIYELFYPTPVDEPEEESEFYATKDEAEFWLRQSEGQAVLRTHHYTPTKAGIAKLLNNVFENRLSEVIGHCSA